MARASVIATVPITLADGRERGLRYDMKALVRIENKGDLTIGEHMARLQKGSFASAIMLLWGGLAHEDPNLTLDATADLLDPAELAPAMEAIGRAIASSFGKDDKANNGDAGKEEAPTVNQ